MEHKSSVELYSDRNSDDKLQGSRSYKNIFFTKRVFGRPLNKFTSHFHILVDSLLLIFLHACHNSCVYYIANLHIINCYTTHV